MPITPTIPTNSGRLDAIPAKERLRRLFFFLAFVGLVALAVVGVALLLQLGLAGPLLTVVTALGLKAGLLTLSTPIMAFLSLYVPPVLLSIPAIVAATVTAAYLSLFALHRSLNSTTFSVPKVTGRKYWTGIRNTLMNRYRRHATDFNFRAKLSLLTWRLPLLALLTIHRTVDLVLRAILPNQFLLIRSSLLSVIDAIFYLIRTPLEAVLDTVDVLMGAKNEQSKIDRQAQAREKAWVDLEQGLTLIERLQGQTHPASRALNAITLLKTQQVINVPNTACEFAGLSAKGFKTALESIQNELQLMADLPDPNQQVIETLENLKTVNMQLKVYKQAVTLFANTFPNSEALNHLKASAFLSAANLQSSLAFVAQHYQTLIQKNQNNPLKNSFPKLAKAQTMESLIDNIVLCITIQLYLDEQYVIAPKDAQAKLQEMDSTLSFLSNTTEENYLNSPSNLQAVQTQLTDLSTEDERVKGANLALKQKTLQNEGQLIAMMNKLGSLLQTVLPEPLFLLRIELQGLPTLTEFPSLRTDELAQYLQNKHVELFNRLKSIIPEINQFHQTLLSSEVSFDSSEQDKNLKQLNILSKTPLALRKDETLLDVLTKILTLINLAIAAEKQNPLKISAMLQATEQLKNLQNDFKQYEENHNELVATLSLDKFKTHGEKKNEKEEQEQDAKEEKKEEPKPLSYRPGKKSRNKTRPIVPEKEKKEEEYIEDEEEKKVPVPYKRKQSSGSASSYALVNFFYLIFSLNILRTLAAKLVTGSNPPAEASRAPQEELDSESKSNIPIDSRVDTTPYPHSFFPEFSLPPQPESLPTRPTPATEIFTAIPSTTAQSVAMRYIS